MGDVLQHHGLTGFRRCNQKGALSATDGGDQINGAAGKVFFGFNVALEFELFGREKRGEVFEEDFVFADFGMIAVDAVEADEGEIAFIVFGNAHAAFDGVARMQVEAADLCRGDVDVVRTREVGSVCAA